MAVKTKKRRTKGAAKRCRVAVKSNPRPKIKYRTRTKTVVKYRTRKPNKRRTKRNGPKRTVYVKRRASNRRRTSRNPSLFGSPLGSKGSLMMLGGGFTGLVATKFIPTMLPASIMGNFGASNAGRFVISLASAFVSGWAAHRFVGQQFGDGVLFGGLIQAGSVGLNAFLPAVYSSLGVGLGDLMPGRFAEPENPIRRAMIAQQRAQVAAAATTPAKGARVTMNGLARAYGPAF